MIVEDESPVYTMLTEEYVGKEYSRRIAFEIERNGFSFTVSCRDGTIARIVKTVSPRER